MCHVPCAAQHAVQAGVHAACQSLESCGGGPDRLGLGAAGSVLGLVTHFFTGKSLSTVRVGAKGAKAWKMTRNTMTLLCEQHPILQDALHERAQELMQCAGNGDSTSAGAQSSLPI